ncbi:MAG: IPT/TIG domain-containing protein [Dehalococcoidia bacterium]|nr:IPT/TIG domain-containing protein [Dehalococcoidia bacterium]
MTHAPFRLLLLILVAACGILFGQASPPAQAAGIPAVLSVSPPSGPTLGGTVITVIGTNFESMQYVDFDGHHVVPIAVTPTQLTVQSPAHAAGVVHLFVVTATGTSADTSADSFTYLTVPVVTSVSPDSGSTSGGTTVTITGVGLSGVTQVLFGSTPAAPFSVNSTTVLVQSPSHAAGTVHVRVTNPGGTSAQTPSDNFTYVAAGPVVTGISPNFGPTSGGTVVSIFGNGLVGTQYVSFGTLHIAPQTVSDSLVVVVAPAHAAGVVHLRVTTGSATSPATSADDFIYSAGVPIVQGISPRSGPIAGGTLVTITGTGFSGASSVLFSDVTVAPTSVTETRITVVSPAHPAGLVHLLVTTPLGTSVETVNDDFTYGLRFPEVFSISPASGPTSGGTLVTITGTDLSTAVSVAFGDQLVTPLSSAATRVLVLAPVHAAGVVHLRVVTLVGTTPETSADDFTYTAIPPVVTGISPASGSVHGGTEITISGHGFVGARLVSFGDNAAVPHVVSDSQLRVIAPASPQAGLVHLRVTSDAGVSADTTADNFAYVSVPRVTAVRPNTGSTSGGTFIVISGLGFSGTTVVNFGSIHVVPTVVTDTEIQVLAPPHSPGVVHLRITSTGGTSPDSSTDDFTYVPSGPDVCPVPPLWVNDLAYGSAGGGFYWDPASGMVWTAQRNWHFFAPQPVRPAPQPLWVNALTYGSPGGGFYWDPVSWQVWTAQRDWHTYSPQGCVAQS